jgi:hypothetical protein
MCCRLPAIPQMLRGWVNYFAVGNSGDSKSLPVLCRHCEPGRGCMIYEARPPVCRQYVCAWLDGRLPASWRPLDSGLVVSFHRAPKDTIARCEIFVDPADPDRWKRELWHERIRTLAHAGQRSGKFRVCVTAGRHRWLVMPDRGIEQSAAAWPITFRADPAT